MSLQSTINDKDKTPVEVVEPDSTSRARWPLLAAVAFLILIEIGGTVLLATVASTLPQFECFRTIDFRAVRTEPN
jgi:hypothetical protein